MFVSWHFDTEPLIREKPERTVLFECDTRSQVVVVVSFVSEALLYTHTHTHIQANSSRDKRDVVWTLLIVIS